MVLGIRDILIVDSYLKGLCTRIFDMARSLCYNQVLLHLLNEMIHSSARHVYEICTSSPGFYSYTRKA